MNACYAMQCTECNGLFPEESLIYLLSDLEHRVCYWCYVNHYERKESWQENSELNPQQTMSIED